MNEKIHIPDTKEVENLDDKSARALLKQLIMLISTLYALIEDLRHQNEQMQRALFGPKSERVTPTDRQVKRRKKKDETPEEAARRKEEAKRKREANAEKRRQQLETQVVEHPIDQREGCPNCQADVDQFHRLGDEISEEYEYLPAQLIRREHRREKAVCTCGTFIYGPAVQRVSNGVLYGPGLHAHVITSKCADSLPVERQAKALRRAGIPIGRSTLNDLFHRGAELLEPIYQRMLALVATSENVSADETTIKVQQKKKCRKAWMWTFIAGNIVTYVFSSSRSGETPLEVLGKTAGTLTVDGYTGYNQVTCPDGRTRCGCWSHVRRKFFEALKTAPAEAQYVIDQILEIYLVEYDAVEQKIRGTEAHKALRQTKTKPIVDALFVWLEQEQKKHLPKGPLGKAISYALNQRVSLEVFLVEPKVSVDNNLSERHLRLIALGRKNFLFVGHDEGGKNLAILQSLVSSCIANKVNPQKYLTDVLMRVQEHPQSRIDELLPHRWEPRR